MLLAIVTSLFRPPAASPRTRGRAPFSRDADARGTATVVHVPAGGNASWQPERLVHQCLGAVVIQAPMATEPAVQGIRFFDVEQRMNWIRQVFDNESSIVVTSYEGLTVDFCKQNNVRYILRGLRTSADFEFERSIGQVNKKLYPEIETVFLLTAPGYTFLNSSIVRDILRHGGDASMFVPEQIDLKNISIK